MALCSIPDIDIHINNGNTEGFKKYLELNSDKLKIPDISGFTTTAEFFNFIISKM